MKTNHPNKRGFAIITVLFTITALSLMLGMLIKMSGQRAFTSKRLADQVKAVAYAEAGIDYAYSILSLDFDQKTNSSLSVETPYGEGSYTLTLTPISNQYVVINSVGKSGSAVREAEVLVEDENAGNNGNPWQDYSNMEGFDYAVLSGGNYAFGGSGTVSGLKMHSNSSIYIRGDASSDISISSSSTIRLGNVTIDGSVTATEIKAHKHATATGGITETSVSPVSVPDIDLTPYRTWAEDHGEVYTGTLTLSADYQADGGIIWVDGDVYIDGNSTLIEGSIIATGNIHISGSAEIQPTTTTISMASRDGNIMNTSTGDQEGLIYAKSGDYTQTANGTLYGQVIANGDVNKGGVSDIINYVRSVPTPPGGIIAPTRAWPVMSAWQK